MKPRIQCVLTQWKPPFQCVRKALTREKIGAKKAL